MYNITDISYIWVIDELGMSHSGVEIFMCK
jgi:hypothetical protein